VSFLFWRAGKSQSCGECFENAEFSMFCRDHSGGIFVVNIRSIGVLTGGGDCSGLNAVIRAVVKTAVGYNVKVWGIKNGFGGLVENQMQELDTAAVSGILPRGGTILGTSNRDNPFHYRIMEQGVCIYKDMSAKAVENLRKAAIDALVVIGGDGSIRIGAEFCKLGINIVAVPKTIDNDIPGTERTFGFDTAVNAATDALDRLHTTAESHHRVMILEVMGRYAGWIALHSGLAGGADCILIPEIPYHLEAVMAKISRRCQEGKSFSIMVVAEGAQPLGGELTGVPAAQGSTEKIRLGGIGNKLANEIESLTGIETRCTVLGHLQRGGSPTPFDRVLATRYGVMAVETIMKGEKGYMVALQNNKIIGLPVREIVKKTHTVDPAGELVRAAKEIGISFGEE
jgi:6-phosphofructokinase 1